MQNLRDKQRQNNTVQTLPYQQKGLLMQASSNPLPYLQEVGSLSSSGLNSTQLLQKQANPHSSPITEITKLISYLSQNKPYLEKLLYQCRLSAPSEKYTQYVKSLEIGLEIISKPSLVMCQDINQSGYLKYLQICAKILEEIREKNASIIAARNAQKSTCDDPQIGTWKMSEGQTKLLGKRVSATDPSMEDIIRNKERIQDRYRKIFNSRATLEEAVEKLQENLSKLTEGRESLGADPENSGIILSLKDIGTETIETKLKNIGEFNDQVKRLSPIKNALSAVFKMRNDYAKKELDIFTKKPCHKLTKGSSNGSSSSAHLSRSTAAESVREYVKLEYPSPLQTDTSHFLPETEEFNNKVKQDLVLLKQFGFEISRVYPEESENEACLISISRNDISGSDAPFVIVMKVLPMQRKIYVKECLNKQRLFADSKLQHGEYSVLSIVELWWKDLESIMSSRNAY